MIADLRKALESGDLESVSQQALEKLLGEQAAQQFGDKRDEIQKQFEEAMTSTGMVVQEEDGLFKLTPGAARSLGEYFLQSVFCSCAPTASASIGHQERGRRRRVRQTPPVRVLGMRSPTWTCRPRS